MIKKLKAQICTLLDEIRAKKGIEVTIQYDAEEFQRIKRAHALDGKTDQEAATEIFTEILRDRREKPRTKAQVNYDH